MTTEEQINLLNERLVKGEITVEQHSQILEVIKQQDSRPTESAAKGEPQPEAPARDTTAEKTTPPGNEKPFKQLAKYSGIQLGLILAITLCSPWLWEEPLPSAFFGVLTGSTIPILIFGVIVNFIAFLFNAKTNKPYLIILILISLITAFLNPFRNVIHKPNNVQSQKTQKDKINSNRDEVGNTALHNAVFKSNIELAKQLVTNGADVNARNNNGWTPIFYAVGTRGTPNKFKILKLLLANGADIHVNDKGKNSVLLHASLSGISSSETINLLVRRGANVKARNEFGSTPLHRAVTLYDEKEDWDIVRTLIKYGANANAENYNGITPLLEAIGTGRSGSMNIARIIIENGADVNWVIKTGEGKGKTILDVYSHPDCPSNVKERAIPFLRKHGGKTGEELKAEGK
jgi:hypothetical protein